MNTDPEKRAAVPLSELAKLRMCQIYNQMQEAIRYAEAERILAELLAIGQKKQDTQSEQ
jgi:hypothetical protein